MQNLVEKNTQRKKHCFSRVTVPVFGSVPIFGRVAKNVKFCTNAVKNFTKYNFVVKVYLFDGGGRGLGIIVITRTKIFPHTYIHKHTYNIAFRMMHTRLRANGHNDFPDYFFYHAYVFLGRVLFSLLEGILLLHPIICGHALSCF